MVDVETRNRFARESNTPPPKVLADATVTARSKGPWPKTESGSCGHSQNAVESSNSR